MRINNKRTMNLFDLASYVIYYTRKKVTYEYNYWR